jgi:hypothetical protein
MSTYLWSKEKEVESLPDRQKSTMQVRIVLSLAMNVTAIAPAVHVTMTVSTIANCSAKWGERYE